MSTQPIHRITLFKIPNESDREHLLSLYRTMPQRALKDGKPYIHSVTAGHAIPDARNQGFTIAAVTKFASEADMKYYDEGCAAHAELREFVRSVREGFMMVYFANALE